MNTVIRHIEYLLLRNDCVIIPDLGAILANREKAKHDTKTNVITPPRRVFTFNESIRFDDKTLLSSSIARAMNISQSEADQIIANEVRVIKNHIYRRGILKIGETGSMLVDENTGQIYFFESQAYTNACSMWLEPVSTTSKTANVIASPIKPDIWTWAGVKRIARAAASVAILLGVCFLASTPLHIDDVMMASLAPELKPVENVDLVPHQDQNANDNIVNGTELVITDAETISETESVTGSDNIASVTVADEANHGNVLMAGTDNTDNTTEKIRKPYHLIIATFSTRGQAEAFISKNPGKGYQIIGGNKMFRISGSTHATKDEASKASKAAQAKFPGAWIYSE